MSKTHESPKSILARWLEVDGILPFFLGGFREHEKAARRIDRHEFDDGKTIVLGTGFMRQFQLI